MKTKSTISTTQIISMIDAEHIKMMEEDIQQYTKMIKEKKDVIKGIKAKYRKDN